MSLKLKINLLILIIASVLVGSLSVFTWSTNQLEDINAKRKFGQVLLTTSDKLDLGKLVLQSNLPEKVAVSSDLVDNVFTLQIAIKTNLQRESQPKQIENLRNIQIQLPAINLLLTDIYDHLTTDNESLTREDLLSLRQLDDIVSEIQETVGVYNRYLNAEEIRITETTTLYTSIIIGMMIILVLTIILLSTFNILRPIQRLSSFATTISQGTYDQSVNIRSRDELGQLGDTFNAMSAQLNDLITNLEKRISERTFALEQRSAYLEGSADVSRAVGSILEPSELISQVVNLIRERFDLYYVGLFLVDTKEEWAVLQSGTGTAGATMLNRGHRIKIGEGMVGWSIANAQSRIALDVGEDAVQFTNPDLPDTHSEGALPLRSRGRVLGALTIQSVQREAFDEETITTLQTMTDQIAIALDNAELLEKSESALDAVRRAYGEISQEAWRTMSSEQIIPGYISDIPGEARPVNATQSPSTLKALKNDRTIQDDGLTAIIPVKSHDQVLGGIKLSRTEGSPDWTKEQLDLAQTLSEEMSVALESARLFDQTQRRATREQVISETSARMRETLNIETVLETAVREVGNIFKFSSVSLQMVHNDNTQNPENENNERKSK